MGVGVGVALPSALVQARPFGELGVELGLTVLLDFGVVLGLGVVLPVGVAVGVGVGAGAAAWAPYTIRK